MPAVRARELPAVGKARCDDRDVDRRSSIEMARTRSEARALLAAPPRTRHLDAERAATVGYRRVELGSWGCRERTVRRATISASIASPVSTGQHRALRSETAHAGVACLSTAFYGETLRQASLLEQPTRHEEKRSGETYVRLAAVRRDTEFALRLFHRSRYPRATNSRIGGCRHCANARRDAREVRSRIRWKGR